MTLALAGRLRDAGVSVAEVNLTLIWDVVSQIKVGKRGRAFVVDSHGRLIAHPEISLVLRNTDLSRLPQVQAALTNGDGGASDSEETHVAEGVQGQRVLTAHAPIAPVGWLVFVELPVDEAFAPLYAALVRTGLLLLGSIILAVLASFLLARKMVTPIRALQAGAARIGGGELGHRIEVSTRDELESLGHQFNSMAARLEESYANLERKVRERTHELELANLAKSRFLAAASHDLRQPLHALGLFVARLRADIDTSEQRRVVSRIDESVATMNQLFNALLDISKLDAGALAPSVREFPIEHLLKRLESTFGGSAHQKGLRLRVVSSAAWVRSDPILLERILLNLVSNAVRYTAQGGIVVGCRRCAESLCIQVWDSGIGIPEDQHRNIFSEFYQLAGPESGGLGLGLAIVERLCGLLEHRVEVVSALGKGSRFTVDVPLAAARTDVPEPPPVPPLVVDPAEGRLVVVVDDDALVLDAMRGLLKGLGCRVATGASDSAVLARLTEEGTGPPDLIISDFCLSDGKTGIDVIERLRRAFGAQIPAFLISGDTGPEPLHQANAQGYVLLHKPVRPVTVRATINRLLANGR